MERKIFVFLLFLSLSHVSLGQIKFINPGFEDYPHWYTPPVNWDLCQGSPDCPSSSFELWFLPAYQGNTYLGLQCDYGSPPPFNEVTGQQLTICLISGRYHSFSFFAYNAARYQPVLILGAKLQLWAGFNQCERDTMLWQSPALDTTWHQYTAEFIPNKSYSYLSFAIYDSVRDAHSYIGIDDLSDITIVGGYNFLSSNLSDTVINEGKCTMLLAASDDASATFQWSSLPAGFTAKGDSVKDCPNKNTQYICTATYSCGYQRSDTLHSLRVIPTPPTPEMIIPTLISVYNNPSEWHILDLPAQTQMILYNTLGQLVYQSNNYSNNLPLTNLAAATYFYRLILPTGEQKVGRVVVIR